MFQRTIGENLKKWAHSYSRKPLILRGARQVGKTTAVEMFAKNFDQYIYLNLDRPGESDYFRRSLPVRDVFQAVLLSRKISAVNGRCLLFIDEIQNCQEAASYLRYFHEEMPELHVIAAGSLLEAMVSRGQLNFPVGRVEYQYMFPLSFQEYCGAGENQPALAAMAAIPFPEYAHDALLREFHHYTLIGGMPGVVAASLKNEDVSSLSHIYQDLMTSFLDDIPKYARNQTLSKVMRHCLETAPFEAGKRITFARFGRSEYQSRETGEALKTLEQAMLLHLLQPSVSTEQPILPDLKKSLRLQFLDTGLLNAMAGLQQDWFRMEDLHSMYRGMLAEHIVAQELIAASGETLMKPRFWVRESPQANAEVDFIIPYRNHIIPVEVKAGHTGTLRSLHQFMDRCPHDMAVRLYAGKVSLTDCHTLKGRKFRLLSLPYFLTSRIGEHLQWAFG